MIFYNNVNIKFLLILKKIVKMVNYFLMMKIITLNKNGYYIINKMLN